MILDSFSLNGRVALVTGANRGLGQAMAIALAEAGADVALLTRGDAGETARRITQLGRRCLAVPCDLLQASAEDLAAAVDTVVAELGGLDILVNNAGIIRRQPALEFSAKNWDDVIKVDLSSVFWLSQAAGRVMAAAGRGSIINVASMLSFQGGIIVPSYTAAKSAVAGLTKALANEWAPLGINVNAVAPGYIATDNTEQLRNDPDRAKGILARIPAGRWGEAGDLAGVVVFLASDAAAYMHGAIVAVDGGWLAR